MGPDPPQLFVVDDDPVVLKMTVRLLKGEGYQVAAAATGEEALRRVREIEPDLVLLDVILPGIDGVEVCRRIKADPALSRIYVILLSGFKIEADDQAFGLESGADGYIARPVANRELLARIEAMLRLKQIEEALAERTRALEREVARRRQIEEALRQSEARRIQEERLAAVGQLTAGLAHTFNSILSTLLLRADLALNHTDLAPAIRQSLQIIRDGTVEAATLVEKLLDFSGKALMHHERLDLAELVQTQIETLDTMLPVAIDVILTVQEADTYRIEGDVDRLKEALSNLALNARDAMPDGGALHTDLRKVVVDTSCMVCQQRVTGEWIQLTFQDTGVGIAAEILPHIFEPFFTTHVPERRGLGLPQVLGIVEQHRGHIEVKSRVGAGTRVIVYLPPYERADIG